MTQIVVIGAGVIGLSTAVRLQQDGYNVAIVAKDFPSPFEAIDAKASINYTSQWGGAHNRWVIPANETEERDHAMALVTFQQMESLNKSNPEAGITFMPGIEYLENPPAQYRSLTEEKAKSLGLVEFRRLKPSEFPDDKVKWGCEYWTWCVNPMIYCSFLLRRFSWNGGEVFRREISNPREGFTIKGLADVRVVINCSGFGFGDKDSFITRGQTCAVANYSPATVTRQNADGSWSFCVPRNFDGGTIVGGTKEPDNWDPEPSVQVREKMLKDFAATYPSILGDSGEFRVLKDIVGRRPTRKGGMRLEREEIGHGRTIIHAYGLGGRGFELSWGVAEEVLELLGKRQARARL
ncbi:Putative FAD dependent oxidoreductase, D-amino acid oxidase, D-amino-acid oxidase [Colletotrichum destructivum]|uniref:FAD dependent oxidoreductase, D-amino acid oxidase, D-amino-acid oxidase n=1 Tax=Colletotrichum destructivum TaxID=34406 RepID=A0AAX4IVX7_9PEZI|nr:Putative FAD dependent oxidoreductase, D-amino acid oxidase, D-amino-acid oxidase [Colletotrichum destructivum]